MNVFLIHAGDDDFSRELPSKLDRSPRGPQRAKLMAFPPLGIQTLAPVLRQHGHQVRMFDTCHPEMKPEHLAHAVSQQSPDVIGISFLSTTYPAAKSVAALLKAVALASPADRILADCPQIDCVGVGEGEELLPDYLTHLQDPGDVAGLVWRNGDEIVQNAARPLLQDLDRFPYPDRSSLPFDYIESLPLDVPAALSLDKFCTMQTSRGCPTLASTATSHPSRKANGAAVLWPTSQGYAFLFASRLVKRPLQTYRLLRTFSRHMQLADILRLLTSPFRPRKLTRQPELPASMLEPRGAMPATAS